jgi:MFS superfamily sulfate permease-like transporter
LVFTNFFAFKEKLNVLPKQKQIIIYLADVKVIDHSSFISLEEFKKNYEREGGIVNIGGHDSHYSISSHPKATRKKKMAV